MTHDHTRINYRKRIAAPVGAAMAVALVASCSSDANSADESEALEGQNIEMHVGYAPGGSYDQWMRAVQPLLEEETGARSVVRNTPGAGGLLAMANLYNAPENSVHIGNVNVPGVIGPILAEAPGVNFELDEFHWIGNMSGEPEVMIVAADSPISSLEEMAEQARETQEPVKFGAPGPDNFYLDALVLGEVFDFPVEVVTGYDGVGGVFNAVLQGDLDAAVGTLTTSQSLVQAGEARPLVAIGDLPEGMTDADIEEIMGLPVPTAASLYEEIGVQSDEGAEVLENHQKVLRVGRPLAAAPATSEDHLAALRSAYSSMVEDGGYIEAMRKQNLFPKPMGHEEVDSLMSDLLEAPESYVALVRAAYTE